MAEYLDLVSIDPIHILITIINLLILFLIFKKYLFKPVQKIFDQRKQEIDRIYDDANAAQAAAQKDKEAYAEKMDTADAQAAEIVQQARDKAGRVSDSIVSEANEKAAAIRKKAEEDIAQERKKAVNEIKNEISAISVDIAQKVVEREINAADQQTLIDSFIDGIGEDNG